MKKSICLAFLVAGCVDPNRGGGGVDPFVIPDLAQTKYDLSRAAPRDMASAPVDFAQTDDAAVDLTDMAMMVPPDLHKMKADLTVLPGDMLKAPVDMAGDMAKTPMDLTMTDGGGGCHLLVNEVQTQSSQSASEEFVELFNPCANAIDLSGWSFVYRSASNAMAADATGDNATKAYPMGAMIPAGGYYTACTTVYKANALGMKGCDFDYGASGIMSGTGGGIGLRDANKVLVDSVGYGTATNSFVQGTAAPAPPASMSPGTSIGRLPNGVNTGDNMADWKVTKMDTPNAANM